MAILSKRTKTSLIIDALRLKTRALRLLKPRARLSVSKLHLGCGARLVGGWHNVDLVSGDERIDLGARLPWPDHSFDDAVAQQVVEHLDLRDHLPRFLKELHRVMRPQGRVWVSCPDIEKLCHGYIRDRCKSLYEARQNRYPVWWAGLLPTQHMLNEGFHQDGQHLNLFDHDLLCHLILKAGFSTARPSSEDELIAIHPEFPRRYDHEITLYVMAVA